MTLYGKLIAELPERQLPYRITHCYLPPDAGECAPPQPKPDRSVLDLLTRKGWKAELVQLCTDSHLFK